MNFKLKRPALILIDVQKAFKEEPYWGGNRNNISDQPKGWHLKIRYCAYTSLLAIIVNKYPQYIQNMIYNRKVTELRNRLYRNVGQTGRVIKAKQFINQHYRSAISLDTIANAANSSKFHLTREFKRHYGITPAQYVKEKRMIEAKRLLADDVSVTGTCFAVGYDSLSTFSLLSRRWTGTSPSEFKKARMNK